MYIFWDLKILKIESNYAGGGAIKKCFQYFLFQSNEELVLQRVCLEMWDSIDPTIQSTIAYASNRLNEVRAFHIKVPIILDLTRRWFYHYIPYLLTPSLVYI